MNAKDVLRQSFQLSHLATNMLLGDMSDADLLVRPVPGANHSAWQLGHLIVAENRFGELIRPGSMPKLPEGFAEKHSKNAAGSDNPADFLPKAQYVRLLEEQRRATLRLLDELPDAELDKPGPKGYEQIAPTVGALFVLTAAHETMHNSQLTPVRRKLGKPVVF